MVDTKSEGVKTLEVEFSTDEFQFYKERKPTGHFARGSVVEEYSDAFLVKCFSNGKRYRVNKDEVIVIDSQSDYKAK